MTELRHIILTEENIADVARRVLSLDASCRIFLLNAPMGAGKTTFIKQLCRELGSSDNFSSPTFSLINEYTSPTGKIYHMDLYRINSERELADIGLEDYLYSGQYCFIEWPQLALTFIDQPRVSVNIEVKENIRYLSALRSPN